MACLWARCRLQDPYILSFLGLEDTYSEKGLENAILAELQKLILEMGAISSFSPGRSTSSSTATTTTSTCSSTTAGSTVSS